MTCGVTGSGSGGTAGIGGERGGLEDVCDNSLRARVCGGRSPWMSHGFSAGGGNEESMVCRRVTCTLVSRPALRNEGSFQAGNACVTHSKRESLHSGCLRPQRQAAEQQDAVSGFKSPWRENPPKRYNVAVILGDATESSGLLWSSNAQRVVCKLEHLRQRESRKVSSNEFIHFEDGPMTMIIFRIKGNLRMDFNYLGYVLMCKY